MRKSFIIIFGIMLGAVSCTTDYVCYCEVPAEDTVLVETTSYPGLRQSEAELVEEECEERSICRWLEDN